MDGKRGLRSGDWEVSMLGSGPLRMEIVQCGPGDFDVAINGMFAGPLTRDEALGMAAAAIYRGEIPPWLRMAKAWIPERRAFGGYDDGLAAEPPPKPGRES